MCKNNVMTDDDYCFLCNIGNFIRRYAPGTQVPTEEVFQGCAHSYNETMTYDAFCEQILSVKNRLGDVCRGYFDIKILNDENGKQRIAWLSFH